ncbi:hypothetical protein [Embleya sp. NPDC020886]|uniref:hypothetical protein n=1 Tax=Embleya sp. NPDC020886 TaxID=3363980 RepID=UPI003795822F
MAEEQSAPASAHTSARTTKAAERRTVLCHPRADLVVVLGGMPAVGLLLGLPLPPPAPWRERGTAADPRPADQT